MGWRIPLADLDYGPEEEEAVLGVLRSKWLTMGAVTQSFEEQFARATATGDQESSRSPTEIIDRHHRVWGEML